MAKNPIVLLSSNSQVGTNTTVEIDDRSHVFNMYITASPDFVNGNFNAVVENSDDPTFTGTWVNIVGSISNLTANTKYYFPIQSNQSLILPVVRARITTGATQGFVILNLFVD